MGSMNLSLPTPSSTAGPTWATNLNTAVTTIEEHDHSSGKGVAVPSAGLNINAELDCNNKDLVQLRSVRFYAATASPAAAADVGCLYIKSGDFYYKNTAGDEVQITSGSALSAVSTGAIDGLPSGTASVAFAAAVYTFKSATNTAANIDHAASVIRDSSVTDGSAKAVTLDVPDGLTANYALTLPGALPASGTKFLRVSSAGAITDSVDADASTLEVSGANLRIKDLGVVTAKINDLAVTTAKLAALGVTRAKMEALGQQISGSSGTFATAATSYTDVTNLSVTLTTTGRPIRIECCSSTTGYFGLVAAAAGYADGYIKIQYSGTSSGSLGEAYMVAQASSANVALTWSPAALSTISTLAAGTYTFVVRLYCGVNCAWMRAYNMNLVAYEL